MRTVTLSGRGGGGPYIILLLYLGEHVGHIVSGDCHREWQGWRSGPTSFCSCMLDV